MKNNFWNGRLHPSSDEQANNWFWPTDLEFNLIHKIVSSDAYVTRYVDKYGQEVTVLLFEKLFRDLGRQYVYLSEKLPQIIDDNLTEDVVYQALDQFDLDVVLPWLQKKDIL